MGVKKKKRTILVVDDKPEIRNLMREVLDIHGYNTILAASHDECLEKLKEMKPDLILLDIMMPEIDGWKTLKAIKDNPETKDIPVAMLTVVIPTYEDFIRHDVYSLVHYITKPFTTDSLIKEIEKIFKFQTILQKEKDEVSKKLTRDIAEEYEKLLKMVSVHERLMNVVRSFSLEREPSLKNSSLHLLRLQLKTIESYKKRLDEIRKKMEEG